MDNAAMKKYRKALAHPPPYDPDVGQVVQLSWSPR